MSNVGAGEIVPQLRAYTTLVGDLSSVPSTQWEAHYHLQLQLQRDFVAFGFLGHLHIYSLMREGERERENKK